jgi:hypothetical protein
MHYQNLEIGHGFAIPNIAKTEACHDRRTAVCHTRNCHNSCRWRSSCIPLAAAAGDLLVNAACHSPADCATHGTGAGHRCLGASAQLTSMKERDQKRTG